VILLDTHTLVWLKSDSSRLSRAAAKFIRDAAKEDAVAIAAITLYEVAWLAVRGRLFLHGLSSAVLEQLTAGVNVLPLTAEVAAIGAGFPASYPKDPADRIIGGTAVAQGIVLVTSDEAIRKSGVVKTVW
jgi:PIN domain nuclease of toxin-antitoxin system